MGKYLDFVKLANLPRAAIVPALKRMGGMFSPTLAQKGGLAVRQGGQTAAFSGMAPKITPAPGVVNTAMPATGVVPAKPITAVRAATGVPRIGVPKPAVAQVNRFVRPR